MVYRISLILLLPLIAVALYMEGQDYDPALIDFSKGAADDISRYFPREAGAYLLQGRIRSYSKDDLYEYIDGHAEYFISSGFVRLTVAEYGKKGRFGDGSPAIVVDLYDMGRPVQALGVLADEAGGTLGPLRFGAQGARSPAGVIFQAGRYFIRISSFDKNAPIDDIGDMIYREIGRRSGGAPEFAALPEIGKVTATRFVRQGYRGLDFVNNVIEREYEIDGGSVTVFAADSTSGGGRLVADFLSYFRDSGIQYEEEKMEGARLFRVRDPYEGEWVLVQTTESVYGFFGEIQERWIMKFIEAANRS